MCGVTMAPSDVLELAARNDLDGFRSAVDLDPASVDAVGLWYGRDAGSAVMGLKERTPLTLAAAYGSLDVLGFVLGSPHVHLDRCLGPEKSTALHCAAASGAPSAVDAVKLILSAGADPNSVDASGRRPLDVISVNPGFPHARKELEQLLSGSSGKGPNFLRVSTTSPPSSPDPLTVSSSPDEGGSPSSDSGSVSSPTAAGKYPVDPSLPDINSAVYAADEFRMYAFKVRPCSRAYSHDWTECPFAHPGENARRRDPRRYNYSCIPCPEFRNGSACRRGDSCEYAHGVFECWLHPAQYRTRLCKDGDSCARRVCFFAHRAEELRSVYSSLSGLNLQSPRSAASIEMAMMGLLPASPRSSVSASSFNPPISPSGNGVAWPQSNVPLVHLPESNPQSSRLRSSLSARDVRLEDFSLILDFDAQRMNDVARARLAAAGGNGYCPVRSKTMNPSSYDGFLSSDLPSSPRYRPDHGALLSPSHKAAVLNQLHHHQQSLPPINTNAFSPKTRDQQQQMSFLQASLGVPSPGRLSPRGIEPRSPFSPHHVSLTPREKLQHVNLQSPRSGCDFGSSFNGIGSPVNSPTCKWGSPSGKLDWGVNSEELDLFKRMSAFDLVGSGGCNDSWANSMATNAPDIEEKLIFNAAPMPPSGLNRNGQMEDHAVLGSWLEQIQLDEQL